jgi:hypothetical protein
MRAIIKDIEPLRSSLSRRAEAGAWRQENNAQQ